MHPRLKICDFGLARPAFSDMPTTIFWTDYVATRCGTRSGVKNDRGAILWLIDLNWTLADHVCISLIVGFQVVPGA